MSQLDTKAHRGSLRSSHVSPKSVTTYSHSASTASASEAVSRMLQLRVVDNSGTSAIRRRTYNRKATFSEHNIGSLPLTDLR